MKTQLIKTDGTVTDILPENPRKGFSLKEVYRLLNCNIVQVVELADERIMILDEDGKSVKEPIVNWKATTMYRQGRMLNKEAKEKLAEEMAMKLGIPSSGIIKLTSGDDDLDTSIVGDVIVCPPKYFK